MIHGMMLVRNESNRTLQKEHNKFAGVLTEMNMLCDTLTVIDDESTDDTVDFIQKTLKENEQYLPVIDLHIIENDARQWDKNEVSIRKCLWNETVKNAKHGDWIVCLDADELIDDGSAIAYVLDALPPHVDGLGFRLFDMWNMTHYREDEHWKAHFMPWVFAVRYDTSKEYVWHEKALHCGRFPANASQRMLPTMIPVRHFGWALAEDRKKKYDRYMRIDGEGKHGILAQYESILDEKPNLVKFGGAE